MRDNQRSDYQRLDSLWTASTQRGQMFFLADFFGQRQFVALNPPVACRHSEPHEVAEAYTFDEASKASSIWGPEPGYLYSPSPGTIAPILNVPDGHVLVYNIHKCRPEPTVMPFQNRLGLCTMVTASTTGYLTDTKEFH